MSKLNIEPFVGAHCETTTVGTILKPLGIELSEAMLFGLGEGLGFIFWKMKGFDFPFIGGRVKTDVLTSNICNNLDLKLEVKETSSIKKAWNNLIQSIDQHKVVGLKLDCYHLEYFTSKIHFAGHYVACYGYDQNKAFLIDTEQQGCQVTTSLDSLALARSERGPMSSRNRSFTIDKTQDFTEVKLRDVLVKVIKANTKDYLSPPISNFGHKGILKTGNSLMPWFESSKSKEYEFCTVAMMMEKAGTGGSLFRNLYRDFLHECYQISLNPKILIAYEAFIDIANLWKEVSQLLDSAGKTKNKEYIQRASKVLTQLSLLEKEAMQSLSGL